MERSLELSISSVGTEAFFKQVFHQNLVSFLGCDMQSCPFIRVNSLPQVWQLVFRRFLHDVFDLDNPMMYFCNVSTSAVYQQRTVLGRRRIILRQPRHLNAVFLNSLECLFLVFGSPFDSQSFADLLKAEGGKTDEQLFHLQHRSSFFLEPVNDALDAVKRNLKLGLFEVHYYSTDRGWAGLRQAA